MNTVMVETRRDFIGYADRPPCVRWPAGAGLAINFVLNYEEGSEYSVWAGDGYSETALIEVTSPRVPRGERDFAAESMDEYGARVGFWRVSELFLKRNIPLTIFAAAQALEYNARVADAIAATDWDLVAHGFRWIEHYSLDEAAERGQSAAAYSSLERSVGRPPQGWYCRSAPSPNTRRLLVEHGGYSYDSDAYNDELPYWTEVSGKSHLVVPYSLVTNDAKLLAGGGIETAHDYAQFLIDSFDILWAEGQSKPRMMSIGLHPRIGGHPGRFAGLVRFLDHVMAREDVWIARRADIATYWKRASPPSGARA